MCGKTTNKELLELNGYKLVSRDDFIHATDRPTNLMETRLDRPGMYVVYDPHDDEDGWFLVGDDAEALAKETVEYRCDVGVA
jgi:hypothetical protein